MFSATRVLLCTFFASCLFSSQFLHARGHVVDTNVGRALKSRKAAADPVLQDLLTNNQAWASITERAYPGIFKTSSQEQHPQVRTLRTLVVSPVPSIDPKFAAQ